MSKEKQFVTSVLQKAGITVNGNKPYDIHINDDRLYKRVFRNPNLALGESYMDGWWTSRNLDQFIEKLLSSGVREELKVTPQLAIAAARARLTNKQTLNKAKKNAEHHYNVGNDLYELMLDKRMIYSCAYWKDAKTLDDAQEAKLDLICRKLHLKKGMTLLDIGCGWGGFAEYAARKYGVKVTGISPASEQVKLAKIRTKGLDVKILQKDYRHLSGTYDRIVSIGMLEHVGPKNYNLFFNKCNEMLKKDGIMLHHTIGSNSSIKGTFAWIDKYIFPGGVLPSVKQISKSVEKKFIIEDLHNFGPYYDKTLMEWHKNFTSNYNKISDKYDERFYRMWEFYLLSCAGMFRSRQIQLWQIVFRKQIISDVYQPVR